MILAKLLTLTAFSTLLLATLPRTSGERWVTVAITTFMASVFLLAFT